MGTTNANVQDPRYLLAVNFASTASVSSQIDLAGYRLAAIDMSTAWTAANLTFAVGSDTVTLQNLYDDAGNEVTVIASSGRNIGLVSSAVALALESHRWIQLRSGTSATPVAQAAARVLNLVAIP